MTAIQMTQKRFQRIDVEALERLMVEADDEPVQVGLRSFIQALRDLFSF